MVKRVRRPFEYLLAIAQDYFKYNDMVLKRWLRYGKGGIRIDIVMNYLAMRERFLHASANAQQLIQHYDAAAKERVDDVAMQPLIAVVVVESFNDKKKTWNESTQHRVRGVRFSQRQRLLKNAFNVKHM